MPSLKRRERERESNMGAHGKSHEWRSARKQMGTWNEASPLIWSELVNSKQQTDLPGMKEGSHLRVRTQTETGCRTFVSHLTSLCFSFLSWKMCKMKHPSEKVWGRMKWANIRNIQHWFCTWQALSTWQTELKHKLIFSNSSSEVLWSWMREVHFHTTV